MRPVEADQQLQELRVVRFIDGEPQSEPVVADADGSPDLYQLYRSYAAGWTCDPRIAERALATALPPCAHASRRHCITR